MARLLNIQIDILALAKAAPSGAPAPAPAVFQQAVDRLLIAGLLREEDGTISITKEGEAALADAISEALPEPNALDA
jgi:hypothetical protein